MNEKIIKLQHKIEKKLDEYRYEHTLGVMYTAAALAMRHEVDLDEALLAGLLHDCAKCYSDEKKFEMCEKYGVNESSDEYSDFILFCEKERKRTLYHNLLFKMSYEIFVAIPTET